MLDLCKIIRKHKNHGIKSLWDNKSFHIHVGYPDKNIDTSCEIVKLFDLFLGIPSVVWDPDKDRRKLYGKAGAFRLTDYGVEYRVLSSYCMSSPELLSKVWWGITNALRLVGRGARKMYPSSDKIVSVINNSDVEEAKRLISKYGLTAESLEAEIEKF